MKPLADFRDTAAVQNIAREISALQLPHEMRFMEVCGGHTAAIYRFALPDLLPPEIRLLSGPGCPVCVTANDFVDRAIALAMQPNITIATFGDLVRVPGSTRSLTDVRAQGANVRVFYSAADALDWAREHSERTVIFLGIGFETTACTLAATMALAVHERVRNFHMLSALKTMPAALRALFSSPDVRVDGLILPGHVTAVTGSRWFDFVPQEFKIPCVVSGFEPADLMRSILMLARQVMDGRAEVENEYSRVVRPEGNMQAKTLITQMFEPCAMNWRGFGDIPGSGLRLRDDFAEWDALNIEVAVEETHEHPGCRCGDVLRGSIHPTQCALFGKMCTPESPRGACMVSAEGACAAFYHFSPYGHEQ